MLAHLTHAGRLPGFKPRVRTEASHCPPAQSLSGSCPQFIRE